LPDNPAFFKSGIRPDTGFDLRISGRIPDIENGLLPDIENGRISGQFVSVTIIIHNFEIKKIHN
jgi:hypothetical protein